MKRRLSTVALVGALAVILLLSGCGEKSSGHAAPAAEKNVIKITNIADLPAAIAPSAVIELPAGLENISVAFGEDYNGDTNWEYARLDFVGDGYGLVIKDVSDLTIRGAGIDKTELVVEAYYADVIRFENCSGVTLEKMTMGHQVEPGE